MTDRRELFRRAAFDVVAERGLRALTHRAVDDAAEVPPGSVNYYAPNRSALLQFVLQEAFERMRAIATREFGPVVAARENPDESLVLDRAVSFVGAMTTEGRGLVLVRHALLIEAQFDNALRERVRANRQQFVEFTDRIALASRPDRPVHAAEMIVALVDGLIQQQTLVTAEPFADDAVRSVLAGIFGFTAT